MEQLQEYNKKLLYNILPVHVAQHFLNQKSKKNEVCLSGSVGDSMCMWKVCRDNWDSGILTIHVQKDL